MDLTDRSAQSIVWSKDKLQRLVALGVIRENEGRYYLRNKEIVLPEKVQQTLERHYEQVPPSTGILRWKALLDTEYLGIRRQQVIDFLKKQPGYIAFQRLHNVSHTRALVVRGPSARFQLDHKSYPTSAPPQGGFKRMLVAIDLYSKKAWVYPHRGDETALTNRTALQTLLNHDLTPQQRPRVLQYDNGPCWQGVFKEYVEQQGIRVINSDPRHPSTQGTVERVIQTLSHFIAATAEERYGSLRQWPRAVDECLEFYNKTRHRILGKNRAPDEIWEAAAPNPVTNQIVGEEARKRRNTFLYDRKKLKPGDKVVLSLRISARTPLSVKEAIYNKVRKGYLNQYDTHHVYTVERLYGHDQVTLEEIEGRYNLLDLQKVPEDFEPTV